MWHFVNGDSLAKMTCPLPKDSWLFGMKALETVADPVLLTKAITEIQ
jgi:hypothetical protein